jgi:site-specific recombinase XerD
MSYFKNRFIQELQLKGYSKKTVDNYTKAVERLVGFYKKPPLRISAEEIKEYIIHLKNEKKLDAATCNLNLAAIKYFYRYFKKDDADISNISQQKQIKKIPVVLSTGEVQNLLEHISNLKHKAILTTIYSAGLRLNELVHLEIRDVDSKRMSLHIRDGKGKKDRYTILSSKTLELLRLYYKCYKPRRWLFEGRTPGKPVCPRLIQSIITAAVRKVKLGKKVSSHTLRHSFATHLLEAGYQLQLIQHVLGHKNVKTTTVYTHVTDIMRENLKSPLDLMNNKAIFASAKGGENE